MECSWLCWRVVFLHHNLGDDYWLSNSNAFFEFNCIIQFWANMAKKLQIPSGIYTKDNHSRVHDQTQSYWVLFVQNLIMQLHSVNAIEFLKAPLYYQRSSPNCMLLWPMAITIGCALYSVSQVTVLILLRLGKTMILLKLSAISQEKIYIFYVLIYLLYSA